jgi:hypothetical protein
MFTESDFVLFHATYGLYLAISIGLTVWVARVLTQTGETFLIRCFGHDTDLARSTNRLLVIGFYLVNLGFISLRLGDWTPGYGDLIGELGVRIGVTLLVLGGMHFFNMLMIARMGRTIRGWIADYNPGPEAALPDAPVSLPPLPPLKR